MPRTEISSHGWRLNNCATNPPTSGILRGALCCQVPKGEADMVRQGFKVMDSDIHVTEPADLWEKYIEPAYKDRAPQFAVSPSQPGLRWRFEGKAFPAFMDLPERQRLAAVRFDKARARHVEAGRYQIFYQDVRGDDPRDMPEVLSGEDPRNMLKAMDTEGIDVSIV